MDILDFTGKVVLVTGGARGVGRASPRASWITARPW
jgi:short-subunit dehydrogenase involved in D-alanine esterification of teichoic acids